MYNNKRYTFPFIDNPDINEVHIDNNGLNLTLTYRIFEKNGTSLRSPKVRTF